MTEARIIPRTRVVTMLACRVLLYRRVNAILIKELIELLVERMAGQWRELFVFQCERRQRECARRRVLQRTANPPEYGRRNAKAHLPGPREGR